MSVPSKFVVAGTMLLASVLALPAIAADRGPMTVGAPRADFGSAQGRRAAFAAPRATATAATVSTAAVTPNELTSSSYRAYPASCFSDTLPSVANTI